MIIGFVLGMTRLATKIAYGDSTSDGLFYHIVVSPNWLHFEIALFFIVIVSMILISYFTPAADPAKIQGLYFGSATPEQKAATKASYNNWDLIHSGIIIVAVIAFYAYFW
jgi:SSS family solute:Na+ symporter